MKTLSTRAAVQQLVDESNARFKGALERDRARAKRQPNTKGHTRIDQAAFMRAVAMEGPEVLSPAGDCYWRDMANRYEHLRDPHDIQFEKRSYTSIYREGKWWRKNENGEWEEEPPRRRDWSKE